MINELPIFSGWWSWVWIAVGAVVIWWYLSGSTDLIA
jgi:hypothetical protein